MENHPRCSILLATLCTFSILLATSPRPSSELIGQCTNEEVPGTKELHKKLGKPHLREKQYATITFKKRTRDESYLTGLKLKWKGGRIDHLHASLFKKDPDLELKPIPDNVVSEGSWSAINQELSFVVRPSHPLKGTTGFCIVIEMSPELEKILQSGSFSLVPSSLPDPFRNIATENPLILALNPTSETSKVS